MSPNSNTHPDFRCQGKPSVVFLVFLTNWLPQILFGSNSFARMAFSGFLWRIWQGAYEEECRRGWMGRVGSLQAIWVHCSVWVSVCSSPWKHSGPYLLDFFLEISFLIDGKGKCSNGCLFRFLGLSSSRVWGKTPLERSRPYDWLSEFLCLVKELRITTETLNRSSVVLASAARTLNRSSMKSYWKRKCPPSSLYSWES